MGCFTTVFSARVVPTHVFASSSILSTNVHWRFDDKVQTRIEQFDIEVSSVVHTKLPGDRMATISGLPSGTAHSVRVIAVYKDGMRAMSEVHHFITPGRHLFMHCIPNNYENNFACSS